MYIKNNRVGLHIRFTHSPLEALQKALHLQLPFFQCFLVHKKTGIPVSMTPEEIELFQHTIKQFHAWYVHSSYLINLTSLGNFSRQLLLEELRLAETLKATGIVFHLGSAKGRSNRFEGFAHLIEVLKIILENTSCLILLENTAHKNLTLGSDIIDIAEIMKKISYHERVVFCLDTAHAYAFGYDIKTEENQELFLDFLNNRIGFERIALIHLNDTKTALGSHVDVHACFTKGIIGETALKNLVSFPALRHIPLILEIRESEHTYVQEIFQTLHKL